MHIGPPSTLDARDNQARSRFHPARVATDTTASLASRDMTTDTTDTTDTTPTETATARTPAATESPTPTESRTPTPAATPAATRATTATPATDAATDLPIRRIDDVDTYEAAIPGLAELLVDAVEDGASVNFLAGLDAATAATWWRDRSAQVADGTITAFVATNAAGTILACTLLLRSPNPNSPHRAEIGKVLVHRSRRRHGLARSLMTAAEQAARNEGRWLLILDTQTGSDAEHLYRALGWHAFGEVPDHSLLTDGTLSPTTFFWKDLR